jgi:sodium-dependent dicarboxylate transporter 2/3/5
MFSKIRKSIQSVSEVSFKQVSHIGLIAGPLVAITILLLGAPSEMQTTDGSLSPAWVTLALLALMAIWWITEAIPIPVTALLPLVILPLFDVASIAKAAQPYMHPIVVLLMGGFIFAKAIEQWRLHERMALYVVSKTGGRPAHLIGGFMLASALLSMWISNTATAIMMMPIALSVAAAIEARDQKQQKFTIALLLAIAYSCSIGGLGTPIGTPTNLIIIGYLDEQANMPISFAEWMMIGIPLVVVLLPLSWLALTKWIFTISNLANEDAQRSVDERLARLGPMTSPERRTLLLFCIIAAMWAFRRPLSELQIGQYIPLSGLTDHVTAIIAVILCFVLPAGQKDQPGRKLLDWDIAQRIPWGVLLLFGGGMSLAYAISSSGLSAYLGQSIAVLADFHIFILIVIITTLVLALTEVTSNIATASAIMPIVGAMAMETGIPVEVIAVPVALAAGCAFMLPMATGPNAVVFATGQVTLPQMARIGLRINIIAVIIISILAFFLTPLVFS